MRRLGQFVLELVNRKSFLFLLVSTVLFMFAGDLFARAGGGGNYSGGGGSFGGGGGGGGGDIIGILIYLAIRYPHVGVPLLIVVVVVAVVKKRMSPDFTTTAAIKNLENIAVSANTSLAGIKQKDGSFDEAVFLDKVRRVDGAVQEAWCRGDMNPVRTMLSDGLFRRFETQLSIMKSQGIRNAMADHRILKTKIHAVEQDAHFDTIHVAIEATARDVEVKASFSYEEALSYAQKARAERYTEIWSFLRRPSATSLAGGGAVSGQCPSCSAPLEVGQSTKCDHCNALVNSGEYDWVLAEITQPIEWRASSTGKVQGLAALSQVDPAFNRQAAEDRGSYLFWKWMEARVTQNTSVLAKCALKEFTAQLAEQVASGPAAQYKIAVGGVDLLACAVGGENGRDRLQIKVLWSSARSQSGVPSPAVSILTLSRKSGVLDSGSLSYARCPVCQGPLDENDTSVCAYCGTDLAAGDAEWVLEQIGWPDAASTFAAGSSVASNDSASESDGEGTPLPAWSTPDMGNPRERTLLLMRMAAVVMADGVVTKQEMKLLKSASKRWKVPMDAVSPILSGEVSGAEISMMKPSNPNGFLTGLIAAALVDGRIDSSEEKLLLDVGQHMGFAPADTKNMMTAIQKTKPKLS